MDINAMVPQNTSIVPRPWCPSMMIVISDVALTSLR